MTRVLVVDDDELFGQMLMEWLSDQGYESRRETTAEDVLDHIESESEPPDIFLVDERLGAGLSGIELITELQEQLPDSDSILFTGATDPSIARQAYLAGAWRYLRRPFDPDELGFVLEALEQWREARQAQVERDWLRTLDKIVRRLQKATSVKQVGQVLVKGGIELDFDRARFYRVRSMDDGPHLFGVCQAGVNEVLDFENVNYPLENTVYSREARERREPTFFKDRELGPSFLSEIPQAEGYPEGLGEWVIIPIFRGDECVGLLNMDNCQRKKSLDLQEKELLRLFAGQAESALDRAIRHEQSIYERKVDETVSSILAQMGNPAEKESLNRLFLAIRDAVVGDAERTNFLAVFLSKETEGFHTHLHIEGGESKKPYWRPESEKDMVWWLLNYKRPLFLPAGTEEHREQFELSLCGNHAAQSWMGVPLTMGAEVIGALIVEDDTRRNSFQIEHFELFKSVAEKLTSFIQTAWLHEQERAYGGLLRRLQEASEKYPALDEETLWYTTLTLCTADYGARFDRAMLFLAEDGGNLLRGRMAIGHVIEEEAHSDWEEYERTGMNWNRFLELLLTAPIKSTPLDNLVRESILFLENDDALSETLRENHVVTLSKKEAEVRLPEEFLAQFGTAEYCLVPVTAGNQVKGVVVLDNIWETDPNRVGVLDILDILTNQAALRAENIRKSNKLKELVSLQNDVFSNSAIVNIKETVERICDAALEITEADLTAIYMVEEIDGEYCYDHSHSVQVGRRNNVETGPIHQPSGLSLHALTQHKQPIFIDDVEHDGTLYFGERHKEAAVVILERIRATMAVPIIERRSNTPLAMLYIDFRSPQIFDDHDREVAEFFAHLTATAIAIWRDSQGLRETQAAQDRELSRLSKVLREALEPGSDETDIVQSLLEKVSELFDPLPVTAGITLRVWERQEGNPVELHRYIYLETSHVENETIHAKDNYGINRLAMKTGEIQNVPDVRSDPNYRPRYEGYEGTTAELDVPILVDGQVIGALNFESSELAAFTPNHEAIGQRFADIVALAIANVQTKRNLRTALNATSAVTSSDEMENTLASIKSEILKAFPNLSTFVIWHQDPESKELTVGDYAGVKDVDAMLSDVPRKTGAIRTGFKRDRPIYAEDVHKDELFESSEFVKREGIKSSAVFPLQAQGNRVGVMFFSYREEHVFTEEEKRLYPILADVVASTISDSLRLYQIQREQTRIKSIQEVTDAISTATTRHEVRIAVIKVLQKLYSGSSCHLGLYDRRREKLELHPKDWHSINSDGKPDCFACELVQKSLRSGEKEVELRQQTSDSSQLGATLISTKSEQTRVLGALVLESSNTFSADDKEIIRNVARQARIALERIHQISSERFQSDLILRVVGTAPIIHDINQYIGRILHRLERIRDNQPLEEDSQRSLDESFELTKELRKRIELMDFSREEVEPLAVDMVLREWILNILDERSVKISSTFNLCAAGVSVRVHHKAFRRVIYDLTRNAMEAMGWDEANQKLNVSTHVLKNRSVLEIRMNNLGKWIPAEHHSKLFAQMFSSKSGSRGIGLLFIRAAIERMEGEVWLESSSEVTGTTFVIHLPISSPIENEEETRS